MSTKYRNLLFDADQTLIDFEKDMPLAFQYMYCLLYTSDAADD